MLDRTNALPGHADPAARGTQLAAFATHPDAFDARLFARLLAAREVRHELPLLGLPQDILRDLYLRWFPGAPLPPLPAQPEAGTTFTANLRAHMLAWRNPALPAADTACLATIIAHACLRPDHLWRDLGLAGRDDVTRALHRYFPGLPERNTGDMRWKKFLAHDLAVTRGETPQPAPGCPGCEEYGRCFPKRLR
ncbi:nitrogen fixation protein NifQ [Pigmentiphaga sp.]|uniref:nitrogen fixation protein NifQ n=1 Tax=Pigmentiphaga sp. TaxID=1977564 RepID=UPI00128E94FF|nr:nitrogen fixation protein NifQ [Pigmentiphaga sp.]MPS26309.1 nitrogen fixation protein NifQ [Alcaligenaceae bacterium SAGV5]MPS53434.1 nitrogen fixation protein NifQ [Alcaligenaceae bacterium SAGV3]MPT56358.1 nitrogen fixation protein NifQ [Alcaligenaceae bacterium]